MVTAGADQAAPNKIEIAAKRFAFVPNQITVKKGQPVTLELKSLDVTHGLEVKQLGIKVEIPKGRETTVSFVPNTVGTFEGKCSHFCGTGHGSMKFTVIVTE
jgi:cytochrome c oxidase subunit 2